MTSKAIKHGPIGSVLLVLCLDRVSFVVNTSVDLVCLPHHIKDILGIAGGVRVFLGISESVVHAVHDCISTSAKIRRTLSDEGEDEEETFPTFAHGECTVSGVSMLEEGLAEKGEIPMGNKE